MSRFHPGVAVAAAVAVVCAFGSVARADSTGTAPAAVVTDSAAQAAPAAPASAIPAAPAVSTPAAAPAAGSRQVAVLETTIGKIVISFHEAAAPRTVANFKKLVREKFYNGTYFHRVIPRFMIQGGDPNTRNTSAADDGTGGPGYTVPGEIKLPHLRGSVATARQGDSVNPKRASSGSQFFIDLGPQASLDKGGYTVFGQVISGMDVVDQIGAFATDPTLPAAAGGGKNPGKRAIIVRATLEPLSKWQQP